jgi:hypothetical protein
MEQHESPGTNPDDETPGAAMLVGERIGRVAIQMAVDEPETARGLPGFSLREAVFADLRSTLFSKLKIARTATVNIDSAEVIMRVGHAVGVCEEAALQPRSSD